MHKFSRLDEAILSTLQDSIRQLREAEDSLAMVACGMVEDLTGFFVTGVDAGWLGRLAGSSEEKSWMAWSPSEWPLMPHDSDDAVTKAIWELSGTGTPERGDGSSGELESSEYDALRRVYVDRIVLGLQKMRVAGELRNSSGQELWVWVSSVDESDEELDERTFAELQDAELAAVFSARYTGGTDQLLARVAKRKTTS